MKYLPYFFWFYFLYSKYLYIRNHYKQRYEASNNGEKSCMVTWECDIGGGVRARVTGVWGLLYTTGLWYYHPPIQLLFFISILSPLRN